MQVDFFSQNDNLALLFKNANIYMVCLFYYNVTLYIMHYIYKCIVCYLMFDQRICFQLHNGTGLAFVTVLGKIHVFMYQKFQQSVITITWYVDWRCFKQEVSVFSLHAEFVRLCLIK